MRVSGTEMFEPLFVFFLNLYIFLLNSVLTSFSSLDYLQFIVECHGNTLLPQFLGMYRLTVDGVETYMVVTRNVFSHRLTVHRKYDLKVGSVCLWVGRKLLW